MADGTIQTAYIDSGYVVRTVIDANTFTVLGDARERFAEKWQYMINGKRGTIETAEYMDDINVPAPAPPEDDDEQNYPIDGADDPQLEEDGYLYTPSQDEPSMGVLDPLESISDADDDPEIRDAIFITLYKCDGGDLSESDIGASVFVARPLRPEWPDGVVLLDIDKFRAFYPEFKAMTDLQLQGAFNRACLYLDNSPRSIVPNVFERETLLFLLMGHLLTLAGRGGGASGAVSSASEGSVSASFQPLTGNALSQWYIQTSYGAAFWQAVKKYLYGGRTYVQITY